MTETGHRGGLINHPEIRLASDILPTDENAGISAALETAMKDLIWFVPWQTVHFFGYCLIFGSAFAVGLRVLGVAPTIPLHCSDAFMQGCAQLSAEFGLPMQIHLGESQQQAVFGEQRYAGHERKCYGKIAEFKLSV